MSEHTIDEQGRPEPRGRVGAIETLTDFLDFHRATLEWKCRGLSDEQLRAPLHPTTMTLAGLLAHLATVEDYWFTTCVAGQPFPASEYPDGFRDDPAWEWSDGAQLSGDTLRALWAEACDRSRAITARAVVHGWEAGPDEPHVPNLGWVLTHMVEEYARHNGHADLLRESIDGETGE